MADPSPQQGPAPVVRAEKLVKEFRRRDGSDLWHYRRILARENFSIYSVRWQKRSGGDTVLSAEIYSDGKITINIREAEDAERERLRVDLGDAGDVHHDHPRPVVTDRREQRLRQMA
jgi:hypothetical protein